VPPGPEHVSENDEFVVRAPVLWVPLAGRAPLQAPDALHAVALVELHVSVAAPPLTTVEGAALSVAVGGAAMVTVTVATGLAPPGSVHVSEKVVSAVSAPVVWVPLVATRPLQPPEAVHAVALVELHVNVDTPPLATDVGAAANVAAGTGSTATVAVAAVLVPPAPVQISEKTALLSSVPVLWVPLAANSPLQPPEAVQLVAFVELQVSVASCPVLIVAFEAVSDAVGGAGLEPEPPPQLTNNNTIAAAMTGTNSRIRPALLFAVILWQCVLARQKSLEGIHHLEEKFIMWRIGVFAAGRLPACCYELVTIDIRSEHEFDDDRHTLQARVRESSPSMRGAPTKFWRWETWTRSTVHISTSLENSGRATASDEYSWWPTTRGSRISILRDMATTWSAPTASEPIRHRAFTTNRDEIDVYSERRSWWTRTWLSARRHSLETACPIPLWWSATWRRGRVKTSNWSDPICITFAIPCYIDGKTSLGSRRAYHRL
jgi:hypothetical protein